MRSLTQAMLSGSVIAYAAATEAGSGSQFQGLRDGFKASRKRATALHDSQLEVIAERMSDDAADGDWFDEIERVEQSISDDDADETDKVSDDEAAALVEEGERVQASAVATAKKAAKDASFNTMLQGLYEKREEVIRGPISAVIMLEKLYSKEELDAMPVPGSTKDDAGSNRPYDKYKSREKNVKTGNWRTVNRSWVNDFVAALPVGATVIKELRVVLDRQGPYAGDEIKAANDEKTLKGRLTLLQGTIKRALLLHFKMQEAQNFPAIEADYIREDDGSIARGNSPIVIIKKGTTGAATKLRTVSVTQFLSIDWNKVKKAGGSYDAVIAEIGRTANPANQGGKMTLDTADATIAEMAAAFEDKKFRGDFISELNKKPDDSDDLLISTFKLAKELERITSYPGLQARFAELMEAEATKEKAA